MLTSYWQCCLALPSDLVLLLFEFDVFAINYRGHQSKLFACKLATVNFNGNGKLCWSNFLVLLLYNSSTWWWWWWWSSRRRHFQFKYCSCRCKHSVITICSTAILTPVKLLFHSPLIKSPKSQTVCVFDTVWLHKQFD